MSATSTPPATECNLMKVITASSVGTLIEWYDFYIFSAGPSGQNQESKSRSLC